MKTINALIYCTMWVGGIMTATLIVWAILFPWMGREAGSFRDPTIEEESERAHRKETPVRKPVR